MIPLGRKFQYEIRPIPRIWIGLLFALVATLASLVVQVMINGQLPMSYSIMIQIPQYIFAGFSESLVYSTGLELSYSEAPEQMKSITSSLYYIAIGLGYLLALLIKLLFDMIVDKIVSYGVGASLVAVFSVGFFLALRQYKYRREVHQPEFYLSRAWQDNGLVFYGSGSEGSEEQEHMKDYS